MSTPASDLERLASTTRERFARDRALLSFEEWYTLFLEDPARQSRGAAGFALDCIESFGRGDDGRYKLFDAPFADGRNPLVAQVEAQHALVRILKNFVRDGRVSKLVLVHGPNGSAKSRFVDCLFRALEHYSRQREGALYRFSWIFPVKRLGQRFVGFNEAADGPALASYARLPEEEIEARLPCGLKDHPLLLLPVEHRRTLFQRLADEGRLPAGTRVPDYLLHGDLSARNRKIADTLLTIYDGDLLAMLRHVQVERFYLSGRYQDGLVTIFPQMHVDAQVRQLTMNQGVAVLPNILRNVELYDPTGELVDANRGAIEYDDLLKRPIDTFKYLLAACEANRVSLPRAIVYLDLVLLGTSNDSHLEAFKQYPDFVSFKERFELVRMPYVRNFRTEAAIYHEMLGRGEIPRMVAPHALEMAALWAVATRLVPPKAERYPDPLKKYVRRIGPIEKAFFYADVAVPDWVETGDRAEFASLRGPMLREDDDDGSDYEGGSGISPREMKTVILNAAQSPDHACLSALAVFAEIRRVLREKSVHAFLQREAQGDYFNYARLVDQLERVLLDRVNREFLDVTGLVSRDQVVEQFKRYVNETSRWLKGEKVQNRLTGRSEAPDPRFMDGMEARFGGVGTDARPFRERLVQRIAAYRIDHPEGELDFAEIFRDLFEKIRQSYVEEHREKIRHLRRLFLTKLGKDQSTPLEAADAERVDEVMRRLKAEYGYCEACALEALAFLEARLYEEPG